MPNAFTLISTVTTTTDTASIAFTNISDSYTTLMVVGSVRGTRNTGAAAQLFMRVNDQATNYSYFGVYTNDTNGVSSYNSSPSTYYWNHYTSQNVAGQTDMFSGTTLIIPNKLNGNNIPSWFSYGVQESDNGWAYGGFAAGTNSSISSNITKLEFYSQPNESFAFTANSKISLYGIARQ